MNSNNSPGYQHKSSHKSKTARNDDNKLRCMTWSGLREFWCADWCVHHSVRNADSTAGLLCPIHVIRAFMSSLRAALIFIRAFMSSFRAVIESVEFLYHRFRLISGFATYFFSIKIFLVIKLYTITTAVAPTLVII